MPQFLFAVEDRFLIRGRGLVLAPGVCVSNPHKLVAGDRLLLKAVDGLAIQTTLAGLEHLDPNPRQLLPLLVNDPDAIDVPIGTEVWLIDR
ncbi:MAG: hypothetical protein QM754_19715 [Tepidisphaeraceae bacterium]